MADYRFGRLSVLSPRVLRTHSAALVGPRCALAVVVLLLGVRALSTLPSILHGSPLYGARMVSLCRRRRLLLAARAAGSGL